MSDKITITTEKDGRIIVFEGSGTLTLTERVGKWVDTRSTSMSRDVRGVEVEWDGGYTIREADRQPDTLEELEAAWEAAEIPTDDAPIRAGDVAIEKISDSAYAVMSPPPTCGLVGREFRVLSRAPREPWQDLADVIGEYTYEPDPKWLARALYQSGVRVTGGDDDG